MLYFQKLSLIILLTLFLFQPLNVIANNNHYCRHKCGRVRIQFPFYLRNNKFNQTKDYILLDSLCYALKNMRLCWNYLLFQSISLSKTLITNLSKFKSIRFTYVDIKRITNGFSESLGDGAHGAVFKGMLSREILVAVKILNNIVGDGKDFTNEVGTIGKIHHVNVVRLLGFCAEGFHHALVYDFFPNGSLHRFLAPPDNKYVFLGWEKLQQIALGVARGIEYLHLGCEHRIVHFDINPHNVLLDDDSIPKITDFGLAKLCPKNQNTVSMSATKGTLGYIAPEVFARSYGNVSYKSDIYSYGMLLLEMVGGRKNTNELAKESFQVLYPKWIYNLLEDKDVQVTIEDEEDAKFAKKLAIVGLWCIKWNPVDRPSMKTVVQILEGNGDKLIAPPNPFDITSSSSGTDAVVPTRRQNFELEIIHEIEE